MKTIKYKTPVWVVFADGPHLGIYGRPDGLSQHVVYCKEGEPSQVYGRVWPDEKVFLQASDARAFWLAQVKALAEAAGFVVSGPNHMLAQSHENPRRD